MTARTFLALGVVILTTSACSEDDAAQPPTDIVADAEDAGEPTPQPQPDVVTVDEVPCNLALGEACFGDEQCQSGICLVSELTPFGVCTVECTNAPDFCATPDGQSYPEAWCIEMPEDEFKSLNHPGLRRFCVPTCTDVNECQQLASGYTACDDITYLGNPLFPSDPKWVCQNPTAFGKTPVDPFTCAGWQSSNPGFVPEKEICAAYCNYLKTCQFYGSGHVMDCCNWHCFLQLTEGGKPNEPLKDLLFNFNQWFFANNGNALQCAAEDQYGPAPIPDENAPVSVDGKCP